MQRRSSPVQVAGTWTKVALSLNARSDSGRGYAGYGLGIQSDGSLWSWGMNDMGQLGDNDSFRLNKHTPQQISNESWREVSAGWYNGLAIKSDWTLWSWGTNRWIRSIGGPVNYEPFGLGNGGLSTDDRSSPVQVGTTSYRAIATWNVVSAGLVF